MSPITTIAISFWISMAASVGLVITYFLGGHVQVEGLLLGIALGGLGVGICLWAIDLLGGPEEAEERTRPAVPAPEAPADEFEPKDPARRRLLVGLGSAAGTVLAGALALPAVSLGPRPQRSLFETSWKAGVRLVDEEGRALRPGDVTSDGVTTVFPEGKLGSPDSQTVLIRVDPSLLELPAERRSWAVEGCVGYSKICTHAGCPVGLYRARSYELLCPCHQSTFNVLNGAEPVFGPAARPLPQLPLKTDDDGYLVARGDFNEPVGPSFWNMSEDGDS